MTTITHEHLHHLARRHHATMQKLDSLRGRISGMAQRGFGTLETGAGAWLGGMLEGKTGGMALGPVPINLLAGAVFLAVGYTNLASDKYSDHLSNLGNGLVGSWAAATGYAFGKRWKETGKLLGGGGHPWSQPYAPTAAPGVSGALSQNEMAEIVARMQQAAAAPAHG
jgi:hypothetical protein